MVIIDRIIRLITENKVKVDEILAMTFTKAAANEMKEKLKKALLKEFNETGDLKLKEQLEKVNSSSISTIHSFCGDLLKKYFYVVGLDASFEVIDEKKANKLANESIDSLFSNLYEEGDREFLELLPIFSSKRKDYGFRKIVLDLYYFAESEGSIENVYNLSEETHENIYSLIEKDVYEKCKALLCDSEYYIDLAIKEFNDDVKRKEFAKQIKEHILKANSFTSTYELYDYFKGIETKLPGGKIVEESATNTLKKGYKFFSDIKTNLSMLSGGEDAVLEKTQRALSILKPLVSLTKKFRDEFTKTKLENNVVDFSDLQKYALILLEDENILKEVKSKYKYIFIDEYQDVNEVQERLVSILASDNVFMVGDSKQNIYAFRGCDTKYFTQKYKNYENKQGGTVLNLDNNFRSAPEIVRVVNNLFTKVFTKDFCDIDYEKNPMIYGELYKDYKGKVVYHLIEDKPTDEKVSDDVENENRGVYSVIEDCKPNVVLEYLEEEILLLNLINDIVGTKYYDIKEADENKRYKNFSFGDICILIRSNSPLSQKILSTLISFDIPVSIEGKQRLGAYPEIKVLISLVSALCQINQDIPLATIMLNMWNFTDKELCTIREIGGKNADFYSCINIVKTKKGELSDKVNKFLNDLDELRLVSEFVSANEVLNRAINKTEWDAKLLSQPYGKDKLKRVERFISESVLVDGKMNIKDFNDYIIKSVDDIKIAESTGEDTVKIVTEHSSKGLEYPCVIIVGCDTEYNDQDIKKTVIMDRKYGLATKLYDTENMLTEENPVSAYIKQQYKNKRAIEEARVLYVAMTRAKCELHVIARAKNVKEEHEISTFSNALRPSDFLARSDAECVFYNDLKIDENKKENIVISEKVNSKLSSKIAESLSYQYPFIEDTKLPMKTSVSSANNNDDEYYRVANAFFESSAEKGTAYHKVFELCDFLSEDIKKEVDRVLTTENFTKEQLLLIDKQKVLKMLNMDIFKTFKNSKIFKERKFCCLVDSSKFGYNSNEQILVQGIIDLFAEDDDGITLIDYKLSTIQNDEDLIKKYKTQMLLYKYAIETITKKSVKKVYILNLLSGKTIEVI